MRELSRKDGRYAPEAFQFLIESLSHAVRLAGKEGAEAADRHVTGQELLVGMRHYAQECFGPLAAPVWRSWGIRETLDWGRVVFLMVEDKRLSRQESDSIEHFRDGFDFDEVFVRTYRPRVGDADGWSGE